MFEFILIQPGTFMMGSPESEAGRFDDETLHQVTITKPFYMQTTPVTQKQWKAIMDNNPSYFKGDDFPVESVSWDDCQQFIQRLNQRNEGTYRLPTEAEWEYACRAGTTTPWSCGSSANCLGQVAWYASNSIVKTHQVAQKRPNAWGLYDMHGNVCEWVQDWYGSYPSSAVSDPQGPSSGVNRVIRGGSWISGVRYARSARRGVDSPGNRTSHLGFRLVKEVE